MCLTQNSAAVCPGSNVQRFIQRPPCPALAVSQALYHPSMPAERGCGSGAGGWDERGFSIHVTKRIQRGAKNRRVEDSLWRTTMISKIAAFGLSAALALSPLAALAQTDQTAPAAPAASDQAAPAASPEKPAKAKHHRAKKKTHHAKKMKKQEAAPAAPAAGEAPAEAPKQSAH